MWKAAWGVQARALAALCVVMCAVAATATVVQRVEDLPAALGIEEPHHIVLTQHISLMDHEQIFGTTSFIEFLPGLKSFTVRVHATFATARCMGGAKGAFSAQKSTLVTSKSYLDGL